MRIIYLGSLTLLLSTCYSGKEGLETASALRDTTSNQKVVTPLNNTANPLTMPIEGIAYNQKGGAVVESDGTTYWIDGLSYWNETYHEKKIKIWGDIIIRNDNPVFLDTGKLVSQGIPVGSEEEMRNQQSRSWITNARYELVSP